MGENEKILYLEDWMSNLPQYAKDIPIIYLAIPGSHDSMTYAINRDSDLAPDAEPVLRRLSFLGPILRYTMRRWSITQKYDVIAQLQAGVRYFDLRVATKEDTNEVFFVHGLYSCSMYKELVKIRAYLNAHRGEVVILDFNHFYAFKDEDHKKTIDLIHSLFDDKLVSYQNNMEKITLNTLVKNGQQVIVIYRASAADNILSLWPSSCFWSPWPNTVSIADLFNQLDKVVERRPTNISFVSQCVLTPTTKFVCFNIFGSLKKKCVQPLLKHKYEWLKQQRIGPSGVNIVIADFVDMMDGQFCREVVELNCRMTVAAESKSV